MPEDIIEAGKWRLDKLQYVRPDVQTMLESRGTHRVSRLDA